MSEKKNHPARGLHGEDQRQGDLRDIQGGTFDANPGDHSATGKPLEQRTPHQDAQSGADVRPDSVHSPDTLPDGLRRERKGPLNKTSGRR